MAIAHGEEVAVAQVQHVWVGQVGILIDLVRIMRCDATLGREGELSDDIMNCVRVPLIPNATLLVHLLRTRICLWTSSIYRLRSIVTCFLIILLSGLRSRHRTR